MPLALLLLSQTACHVVSYARHSWLLWQGRLQQASFSSWIDTTNKHKSKNQQPCFEHRQQARELEDTSAPRGRDREPSFGRKWKYLTVILTLSHWSRHSSGTLEMWQLSTTTLWRYQDVASGFFFLKDYRLKHVTMSNVDSLTLVKMCLIVPT